MQIDERLIASIVEEVLKTMEMEKTECNGECGSACTGHDGLFSHYEAAIKAAKAGQRELVKLSIERREEIISSIRKAVVANAERLALMAFEESQMGRYEDKISKNIGAALKTPGTEDLKTQAVTGDGGLLLFERGPYGLIAAITPITNPTATIINNSISMISAGNSIFFCPHPGAQKSSIETIKVINKAIKEAKGPENLLVCVQEATLDVVNKVMAHPDVKLVVATGGPGVVKATLSSGKKAIGAGPGNPPVVVDETADLKKAAQDIISGASFDNNLPCIAEKVIIAIDSIADELIEHLVANGAFEVTGRDKIERLTKAIFKDDKVNRGFIGKDALYILKEAGVDSGVPSGKDVKMAFIEVDEDHPLVQEEQLMPILPIVRVKTFEEALKLAVQVEHGFRHTALVHSKNIDRITRYARAIDTTAFVVNGPSSAALGDGAEGHITFTIAGPTGEGVTSARSFTRERRLVVTKGLSIR